jgi:hypothetical protein
LLSDGRFVVFRATGKPDETKAQQSKTQATGEQPHAEYDSPQKIETPKLLVYVT